MREEQFLAGNKIKLIVLTVNIIFRKSQQHPDAMHI
jgi:hypothetical protein